MTPDDSRFVQMTPDASSSQLSDLWISPSMYLDKLYLGSHAGVMFVGHPHLLYSHSCQFIHSWISWTVSKHAVDCSPGTIAVLHRL